MHYIAKGSLGVGEVIYVLQTGDVDHQSGVIGRGVVTQRNDGFMVVMGCSDFVDNPWGLVGVLCGDEKEHLAMFDLLGNFYREGVTLKHLLITIRSVVYTPRIWYNGKDGIV